MLSTSVEFNTSRVVFVTLRGKGYIMSTTEGCLEYIGGYSIHRRVFNTSEEYHDSCEGYNEHIRKVYSTSKGYFEYMEGFPCSISPCILCVQYIGVSQLHQTMWDITSTSRGHLQCIGGCSVRWEDYDSCLEMS